MTRSEECALSFAKLAAKDVVDRADDDARLFTREPVVNRLAVAARRHEAIGSQTSELL